MTEKSDSYRLPFLDGMRGWAAIMVALSHLMPFFLAPTIPVYSAPVFRFMYDGELAVCIFFVLSGFALSIKFIESPGMHSVARAATARYFRLVIPVFVTSAIIYAMLQARLFYNVEASAAANAPWLGTFFLVKPSVPSLLYDVFYSTFFAFNYGTSYNRPLWTMEYEFAGSLLIFFIAGVFLSKKRRRVVAFPAIFLASAFFYWQKPFIACFVFGYFLAEFHHTKIMERRWINFAATLSMIIPIYFITYHKTGIPHYNSLLATVFVFSVTFSNLWRSAFSTRLSLMLGKISFPLYLINLCVVCSYSSYLFLHPLKGDYDPLTWANFIVVSSLTVSIAAACALRPAERFSIYFSRLIGEKIVAVLRQAMMAATLMLVQLRMRG